jgi:hypothetical protein
MHYAQGPRPSLLHVPGQASYTYRLFFFFFAFFKIPLHLFSTCLGFLPTHLQSRSFSLYLNWALSLHEGAELGAELGTSDGSSDGESVDGIAARADVPAPADVPDDEEDPDDVDDPDDDAEFHFVVYNNSDGTVGMYK